MFKSVELFSVNTLEIGGLAAALQASWLPQWRFFCNWIEKLPYADTLILGLDDGKSD